MIKEAIGLLVQGENLSQEDSAQVMNEIMNNEATEAQIGSFVTALRMKGETVPEITGMAETMREKSLKVSISLQNNKLVDTAGTGGDGQNTMNISTAAAIVALETMIDRSDCTIPEFLYTIHGPRPPRPPIARGFPLAGL